MLSCKFFLELAVQNSLKLFNLHEGGGFLPGNDGFVEMGDLFG